MSASTTGITVRAGSLGPLTPTRLAVVVASAGTPVQFTATAGTWAAWAVIVPRKASNVANVGNVFFGPSAAVNTQNIVQATGAAPFTIPIPAGAKIDLSSWWLDGANAADGVVVYYGI